MSHTNNTITRWTSPQNPEQHNYWSIHAKELSRFSLSATILQIIHAFIGLAAWKAIIGSGLGQILSPDHWAIWLIALTGVGVCHLMFRTTWEGYWYDLWDDRAETDSSIWLPILLGIILLFTEKQGAETLLHKTIAAPAIQSDTTYNNQSQQRTAAATATYNTQKSEIEDVWKTTTKAIRSDYAARIASQNRKPQRNESDRKYVARNIRDLEAQRNAKLAEADTRKSATIQNLNDQHNQNLTQITAGTGKITTAIATANAAELARVEAAKASLGQWAWVISCILLVVIAWITRKLVRINAKSGRFPVREYTALDQSGGVGDAIADALRRQHARLATWVHRTLSTGTIEELDGTLITKASTYNSDPKNFQ